MLSVEFVQVISPFSLNLGKSRFFVQMSGKLKEKENITNADSSIEGTWGR